MHLKQRIQFSFWISFLFFSIHISFISIGQFIQQLPQKLHLDAFFLRRRKLNLEKMLIKAATGQKKQKNLFMNIIAEKMTPAKIHVIILNNVFVEILTAKFRKLPSKIDRKDLTGHILQKIGGSDGRPIPEIKGKNKKRKSKTYLIGFNLCLIASVKCRHLNPIFSRINVTVS